MTTGQKVVLGFTVGGCLTLLAHPASRGIMTYALQADRATEVVESSPYCREPFELFPPTNTGTLPLREAYLTGYRIARRLNGLTGADKHDLEVALKFADSLARQDPDNAYWPLFGAAIAVLNRDAEASRTRWSKATEKARWETGETGESIRLWDALASADGLRLSWQGMLALSFCRDEPVKFICRTAEPLATGSLAERYDTLLNVGVILRGATSFATGDAAAKLASQATYKGAKPTDRKQAASMRSLFATEVGSALGRDTFDNARSELLRVESWEGFVQPGSEQAERAVAQKRVESAVTACLPSALLATSLCFGLLWAFGRLLATAARAGVALDRRLLLAVGLAGGLIVFWKTTWLLAGLWCLMLGAFAGIRAPFPVVSPQTPWPRGGVVLLRVAGVGALALGVAWLISKSPASLLLSQSDWAVNRYMLGWAGAVVISTTVPFAGLWARASRRPPLLCLGEALAAGAGFASVAGLFLTIATTPLCIYRDAENRAFIERWLANEPQTFRINVQ